MLTYCKTKQSTQHLRVFIMATTPKCGETDPGCGLPSPVSSVCRSYAKTLSSGQASTNQLHNTITSVTRTKLVNALTFNFTTIEGNRDGFIRTIASFYQNKILSIKYLHRERMIQFGFAANIDVAEVIHNGFSINGQVVPKFRCYEDIKNIVRITMFGQHTVIDIKKRVSVLIFILFKTISRAPCYSNYKDILTVSIVWIH
jgi:hypothetical protein